jgi:2-dehydro-3-deoxyglucarate aldolase|tara:strand:+ start:7886 stop:8668 length:783 start_codon:yes stop_codon:yes gene_type:complete
MTPSTIKNINKFRKDLKRGKVLIGGWMQLSNSNLVEIMSNSEYDWIALDMEHGSFSSGDLPDLFRAIELKNKISLVRLPNKKTEVCSQVLDAGCAGVIIPNIKTVNELISLRNACYLPPSGSRGVGYSRANLFGKKFSEYKKGKTKPIVIAMIENINLIKNLEKILKTSGLDAVLIGPYDLSASMNITGKFNHPKFKYTISEIKRLSKKHKIPCGIHIVEPKYKTLIKHVKLGYQFLPYSIDTVLFNSALKKSFNKNNKF